MKLLSILVPTLNRRVLLEATLENLITERSWLPEITAERIEIVVSDNASDDDTAVLMERYAARGVGYHRFANRVEIGESMQRAAQLAQGRFVWLMGDDDLILPGSLRFVIELLEKKDDCVLIYLNRLVVDWRLERLISIPQTRWPALQLSLAMPDFIREFTHWPGFITCMIFRREAFVSGAGFSRKEFEGWEFLAQIYAGGKDGCVWVSYLPSVVQRLGVHSWKAKWPRYWLVNFPRMLAALEKAGMTRGALSAWRYREISLYRLMADVLVAKAFGIGWRDPFWREAAGWQRGLKRWMLVAGRWLLPEALARTIYRLQPKYRGKLRE